MKKPLKFWFIIFAIAPIIGGFEGLEHFAVSTGSIIWMGARHQLSAATLATPLWDYLMGSLSLLIAVATRKVGKYLEKQ